MDEKKLQTLAEELNSFSANTLKYFYWTVSKLCTVIELSSDQEGVEYKLQPRNEERDTKNGAPTPEQEAAIMQGLQKKGFFGFQSALVGADKPIIFGGEHGLTGEAAMRMANDPRSNLERKYEWGWLTDYDLDSLQQYLKAIDTKLNEAIDVQLEEKSRLSNSDADLTIGGRLLNIFPSGKKYKAVKKMAELLSTGAAVSNFNLAKCIKSSLTKRKYKVSPDSYDQLVQHRLRTLKKYWKKIGYTIKSVNTPIDGYQRHSL